LARHGVKATIERTVSADVPAGAAGMARCAPDAFRRLPESREKTRFEAGNRRSISHNAMQIK
jgi:hypothetical protein